MNARECAEYDRDRHLVAAVQLNGRTALDLFSGVGGFALACERVGIRTVAFCEIDPFCRAVLAKNFPGVPVHDDIRTLDPAPFRGVDLVCGGFPCQDLSAAGKGTGIGGARSGLWFEMARIIAGVRPRWCLVENVSALRTRGADRVLADLEALGYDAWPLVVGAWSVGAPHRRERVWIVARLSDTIGDTVRVEQQRLSARRSDGVRDEGQAELEGLRGVADADRIGLGRRGQPEPQGIEGASGHEPDRRGARRPESENLADTDTHGQRERRRAWRDRDDTRPEPLQGDRGRWPARPGQPQHEWEQPRLVAYAEWRGLGVVSGGREAAWNAPVEREADGEQGPTQQSVGRPTDGLPVGLVRARRRNNREALKAYGNAIVPDCAGAILRAMLRQEEP